MLSEVIGNIERLGCLTLHKNVLEVDLLGTSNNFLELLTCQLYLTVPYFVLSCWLRLKLLLDNSVVSLLLAGSHTIQISCCGLIFSDWLFDIKWVHILDEFKFRLRHYSLNTQIDVILNLFKGHWRGSLSLLDLLSDTKVTISINTLVFD